jgi:hypothetical protein
MGGLLLIPLAIANYYVTTFSVWFGHWFAHRRASPTRGFHMDGHHAIYPSSKQTRCVLGEYRGGEGRTNSGWALAPWVALQVGVQALTLPAWGVAVCLGQSALLLAGINYLHEQFHVDRSRLERWRCFVHARAVHDLHHDAACNFMVADHLWDKVFGTFQPNGAVAAKTTGAT